VSSRATSGVAQRAMGSLVMSLALAAGCVAPSKYPGAPAPLLERTFVAPSIDSRDTLLYEAQVATSVFLVDELDSLERALRWDDVTGPLRARRIYVLPMFRIRQLKDSSAAVRTPSFMPSVRYERHFLSADTVPRTPRSSLKHLSVIRDFGFRLEWTHHSNGQAGCFRSGYLPDSTGNPDRCTPGPAADTTGVGLNRANGDFSTTYWALTGFARRVRLDRQMDEAWAVEAALGFQIHRCGLFGGMRDEQRELYGSTRTRLDLSARRSFGSQHARIDYLFELAPKTHPSITRWRTQVDVQMRSKRLLGAGVFARYMNGQDYMNIGFAQRRERVLVGFVMDPGSTEGPRS
jgi:hypothetical protein